MTGEREGERGGVFIDNKLSVVFLAWSLLSWSAGQDPLLPHFLLFTRPLFHTALHNPTPAAVLHRSSPCTPRPTSSICPQADRQLRQHPPGRRGTSPQIAGQASSNTRHLETGNWKQPPLSVKVSPACCDGKRYSVRYGPPSTDSSRGTYAVASPRAWQHQAHIPIPVVLSGPRL